MELGLKDKVAAITGGSIGIGLAVAEGLAQEGVHLALCARNEARVVEAAERPAQPLHLREHARVRDLDVLHAYLQPRLAALEGAEHRAGQRVLRRLGGDRARARAGLHEALDSPRYPRILEQLETFLSRPPASTSDVSLPDVAATEWKRLRKAVQKLPGRPSTDELHAVRIKVKRARYAAELARAAASARGKRFIRQAKKLQDILGDLQDAVVIEQYLHDAIDRTEPAQAVQKHLVKRQRKRRKKARAAFFEEWPKLKRRGQEAWIA